MTVSPPVPARRPRSAPRQGQTDLARVLELPSDVRLVVPTLRVAAGPSPSGGSPLVVVDGAVLQRVVLGNRVASVLLGPGDVLWPDRDGGHPWRHVTRALTPITLASPARVPERHRALVHLVLLAAAERQTARLGHQAVLGQLVSLEDRLAALLPQLADRWGVVTPQGVVLPRFLRHWVLAELVSVRRPSLTTAAQRMEFDGRLRRLDDGRWLLGPGLT